VRPLLALDLALGPGLEEAIRQRVLAEEAFCVLDQRLSPRRLQETLELLGATAVIDVNGRHARVSGRDVDDDIGLVMLTSGSSASPKAVQLTWNALRASAEMTQAALRHDRARSGFPACPRATSAASPCCCAPS